MIWLKNLLEYARCGSVGRCPVCESGRVTVTEHIFPKRESVSFRCEDCGSADHFDGMTEGMKEVKV